MFKRLLGLSLSTRSLQGNILEDSVDALAYYDQKTSLIPVDASSILVAQADGKRIPIFLDENEVEWSEKPVRLSKGQKRGRMAKYARLLECAPIQERVALCDGCEASQ